LVIGMQLIRSGLKGIAIEY
ncbi:hypothetical protein VCHC17A1_3949B, partial [Vibrio cholerae HC-17A1]